MPKSNKAGVMFALCLIQAAMAADHKNGQHPAPNWACGLCLLKFLLAGS